MKVYFMETGIKLLRNEGKRKEQVLSAKIKFLGICSLTTVVKFSLNRYRMLCHMFYCIELVHFYSIQDSFDPVLRLMIF